MKKKYCVWCGNEYDEELKECPHCHKNPNPEENMFLTFLKEKTKDKLKDDTEERTYEIIKNFLLSHVYGVVVTLSLVVAGIVSVSDNNYIHYVEEIPSVLQANFNYVQNNEPNETNPDNSNENGSELDPNSDNYNEELVKNRLDIMTSRYMSDGLKNGGLSDEEKANYWSDNFSAEHELAKGMADETVYGQEPIGYNRQISTYYERYEPLEAESEIAKEAQKQGYAIYHTEIGDRIYKNAKFEPSITAKYSVYFIFEDGDWKFLEEIRTDLIVEE